MKILLDTPVIVEIDRKNLDVINLIKKLIDKGDEIIISSITISEIFTGCYLREDFKKSLSEANKILGQFQWINLDYQIAEKTAQYLAFLITEGRIIEYQDVAIAATFKITSSDYLLTLNKNHFENLPDLKGKIYGPKEFAKVLKKSL